MPAQTARPAHLVARRMVLTALGVTGAAGVLGARSREPRAPTARTVAASAGAELELPAAGAPQPSAEPVPVPVSDEVVYQVHQLQPDAPADAIALTFDDGPDPRFTPQVLDLLGALGITATFCVVGRQVAAHPALVARIVAAGHTLVNHSQNHPARLDRLTPADLAAEIAPVQTALVDLVGRAPTLFRAPGGQWTKDVLAATRDAGLRPLGWDVDPKDWARPGVAAITHALLLAAAGDVVLAHDGGGDRSQTVEAMQAVLPAYRQRGLTFVSL